MEEVALTIEFKQKVIKKLEKIQKNKNVEIAKKFYIFASILVTIIKGEEKYEVRGGLSTMCKGTRSCELKVGHASNGCLKIFKKIIEIVFR